MESRSLRISQIFQQLIDLLLRVVLEPGDTIINTPPTFGMYSFDCSINGTLSSS
jgi:histidinol-phosphate/aromatic aminotransferase/cobyric acid decarboxylase-like protein